MAFSHGKQTRVYANGYDLTGFFNSASIEATRDVVETTVFGQADKTYLVGLRDATLSLDGLFDAASGASDERLAAQLGTDPSIVVVMPQDNTGNPVYGMLSIQNSYQIETPADDVVAVTAEFQSRTGSERLLVYVEKSTPTASGSAVTLDNGSATSNGGVGYLQVFALSGWSSMDVVIEDSADATTWATILTFGNVPAASAPQAQRVAITGTVRRYTRAKWTFNGAGPGSGTLWVGFGRK